MTAGTRALMAMLCAFSGVSGVSTERASTLSTVSGVVVDASGGRPIEGATVTMGKVGVLVRRSISDREGRFEFSAVEVGTYLLAAFKPGYADSNISPRTGVPQQVLFEVKAAEPPKPARLELSRLATVSGTVRDTRGEPLIGAYVRAIGRFQLHESNHLATGPLAVTDDRGRYRLEGLTPGPYLVMVPFVQRNVAGAKAPSSSIVPKNPIIDTGTNPIVFVDYLTPPQQHGREVFVQTFYPRSTSAAEAVTIDLRLADTRDSIDITVPVVAGVSVSGRLVGGEGSRDGIVLRLLSPDLEELGAGAEVATSTPAADGTFTFASVPAGDFALIAQGPRFQYRLKSWTTGTRSVELSSGVDGTSRATGVLGGSASAASRPVEYDAGDSTTAKDALYGRELVSVRDKDVAGVSVNMNPTGRIRGRVTCEGPSGCRGARAIEVSAANGEARLGLQHSVLSSTSGTERDGFAFFGLLPGDYTLRIYPMPGTTIKSISGSGVTPGTEVVSVAAGSDTNVVISMTSTSSKIVGVVSSDVTITQRQVLIFPADHRLWGDFGLSSTWIRSVIVAPDGTFAASGLRTGDYRVVAVDAAVADRWRSRAFLASAEAFSTHVDLGQGETRSLSLKVSAISSR